MPDEPILRKEMVLARDIGPFKNGPHEGVLDGKVISQMVSNYGFKTQVPVFLWDHVQNLDEREPDGWVESLRLGRRGEVVCGEPLAGGELVGRVKLHGEAASLVSSDRIRQLSPAWHPAGKDYQGRSIGAVLQHVTLTNNPYIKDIPNIAAARSQGGGPLLMVMTALPPEESAMPDKDKQDGEAQDKGKGGADVEAQLKEQENTIIGLKAEKLRLEEEIETLKEQIANAKVDQDKEAALVENVNLKHKDFLRDVRAIVEYGLNHGTLLAGECEGYAGSGPLDFAATERWLKRSKFYDATAPNPLESAFRIVNHIALKTKPRVNIGARYGSGAPKDERQPAMTQEEQESVRKLGLNPEMVAQMDDNVTYEQRQALKAQKGS